MTYAELIIFSLGQGARDFGIQYFSATCTANIMQSANWGMSSKPLKVSGEDLMGLKKPAPLYRGSVVDRLKAAAEDAREAHFEEVIKE